MDFNDRDQADDVQRLKREIEDLRERLAESAKKGKQLCWDTELLVKKTQNLAPANKISCTDPNWRETLENMDIGQEGVWIADVRTVEDIQFVAAFAAENRLSMTYGNRSFHLNRETEI
jgi:hypothetical protein